MHIEVGDMVIVPKFGSKTLKTVDRIIYDPVIDRTAEQNMTILLKPYGQCKYRDVSVIRKPRPGGKEARDIVAKILKRALNFKRKIENTSYRLIYEVTIGDYEIAKSMLKDQS